MDIAITNMKHLANFAHCHHQHQTPCQLGTLLSPTSNTLPTWHIAIANIKHLANLAHCHRQHQTPCQLGTLPSPTSNTLQSFALTWPKQQTGHYKKVVCLPHSLYPATLCKHWQQGEQSRQTASWCPASHMGQIWWLSSCTPSKVQPGRLHPTQYLAPKIWKWLKVMLFTAKLCRWYVRAFGWVFFAEDTFFLTVQSVSQTSFVTSNSKTVTSVWPIEYLKISSSSSLGPAFTLLCFNPHHLSMSLPQTSV